MDGTRTGSAHSTNCKTVAYLDVFEVINECVLTMFFNHRVNFVFLCVSAMFVFVRTGLQSTSLSKSCIMLCIV